MVDTAELEEECGSEGPVQLLRLEADERVPSTPRSTARYGDRFLVGIGRYDVPLAALTGLETPTSVRVVSVDACGNDRRTIAEGVDLLFPPTRDDRPWLACSTQTGDVMTIDPTGTESAQLLGRGGGCRVGSVGEERWVAIGAEGGALKLLVTGPEGFSTVSEDARQIETDTEKSRLLFSTIHGELREYVPVMDDSIFLADGVSYFGMSDDGESFVTTSALDLLEPVSWNVFRRGETEGMTLPETRIRHIGDGFAFADENQTVYVEPETMQSWVYEGSWNVIGRLPDGRLLIWPPEEDRIVAVPLDGSEPQTLITGRIPASGRIDGDVLWTWVHDGAAGDSPFPSTVGELVRLPLSGGDPTSVVDDVHQPLGLTDGRWVSVRGADENERGDLWVIDPETDQAHRIDEGVDLHFVRLNGPVWAYPSDGLHEASETFFYTIRDAGERTGLWRATLAPR